MKLIQNVVKQLKIFVTFKLILLQFMPFLVCSEFLQLRTCDNHLFRSPPQLELLHLSVNPLPLSSGQTHWINATVQVNKPLDRHSVIVRTSLFKQVMPWMEMFIFLCISRYGSCQYRLGEFFDRFALNERLSGPNLIDVGQLQPGIYSLNPNSSFHIPSHPMLTRFSSGHYRAFVRFFENGTKLISCTEVLAQVRLN